MKYKKFKNLIKRLCVLLSAVLIFGSALTVSAESNGKYKNMLVLGDSISTGYGLSGYSLSDPYSCASYANRVAEALGLVGGESYKNKAQNGDRSEDLLLLLDSLSSSLARADLIVISIGGNDMLHSLTEIASIISGEEVGDYMTAAAVLAALTPEQVAQLSSNTELNSAIALICLKFSLNMAEIAKKLNESAGGAEIIFLKQYNPMNSVEGIEAFGIFASKVIGEINKTIDTVCAANGFTSLDVPSVIDGDAAALTNIEAMDIHPNAAGHAEIASLLARELSVTLPTTESTKGEDITPEVPITPPPGGVGDTTDAPSDGAEETDALSDGAEATDAPSDTTEETDAPSDGAEDDGCGAVTLFPVLQVAGFAALALGKRRRRVADGSN